MKRTAARCMAALAASAAWMSAAAAPHLDLNVALDPATGALTATAAITTQSPQLIFYLADNFVVESAELNGATVPTGQTQLDGAQRFQVDLPDAQEQQTVTLRYHGKLQSLDTSMTHDDTLDNLPAMSSPAGSYLPGGSGWHPILDSEFTYDLITALPEGHVAVAPGAISDELIVAGTQTARFTMTRPVPRVDLMVGKWIIRERIVRIGEANISLRTYFDEEDLSLSESYLDATHRFIERYARLIGPYPYSGFSVVSSPIPTGFGMPTLTYLGKSVLRYTFIRDLSLGHEVLHSWWGSGVRIDASRGNWAEGLTTFMADYAYREDEGEEAAMRMRHRWLRDYAALPASSERPLSAFRSRHHTASAAIGYGKAAMMFYALRARLGEEAFAQGIRDFWNHNRYSQADFDDLRVAFERAGDVALGDFFDQWLDRTGAPHITVVRAAMPKGSGKLELRLAQDAEPFHLSLPLQLLAGDRTDEVRVNLSAAEQTIDIPVSTRPTQLKIDPRFEVWRKLAGGEAPPILRDAIAATAVAVTATEPEFAAGALAFAQAFSEARLVATEPEQALRGDHPLIVAGSKASIARFLNAIGQPRPDRIAAGSVEVWISPEPQRMIVAVAIDPAAQNEQDLSRLGRRLRHVGASSWVSISENGALKRGNWPVTTPVVGLTP